MGPPSYKWVYKPWNNPYEYYSYIYHKATEIRQLNAIDWGPHPAAIGVSMP